MGGGQGPPPGHLQLSRRRAERTAAARARAVGGGEPARPLVRGWLGPGTRRRPGVPARPDRGPGEVLRPARPGDGAGGHGRARTGPRPGLRAIPGAHRPAQGAGRSRRRAAPARRLGAGRRLGARMGPGHHAVRGPGLVRRLRRLVRPGRRGPRPAGPARGRDPPSQGGPGMTALVTSTERLQRLLALVPYVMSRKVVGLAETAEAFGISERELVDDLNLLWCVELRAPDPYCPIDLSYEGGEIVVSQAESMSRPLRLAVDEASALLVALRMLAEVPGLEDRSAMSRLIAKLEAAAGEAASVSAQVAVQVDIADHDAEGYAGQIGAALSARRRVHLRYYVPGRDETTERDVDPMRLLVVEGRPYLEAWCLRAEGVRLFRLDRVLGLDVLDVPSAPPAEAEPVDVDQGLFRPSPDDALVELELSAAGRWVAEYYPCESVTDLEDGRLRVTLRTPDTGWVRRLALRLGEDGRVVSPSSLVSGVREAANAALANYVVLSQGKPGSAGRSRGNCDRHG